MNYLLDTNIILIYSRATEVAEKIEAQYQFFAEGNVLAVSVVTLGEVDAIVKKLGIGEKRKNRIDELINNIAKVRIDTTALISRYGDIDAFSQGKVGDVKQKFSAKNMGKNDLWIAATASLYNLTLVTTDKDFDHLSESHLKLLYLDIEDFRK